MFVQCNEILNQLKDRLKGDRLYNFWKLSSKNSYHSSWNRTALFCIDEAILAADTEWY